MGSERNVVDIRDTDQDQSGNVTIYQGEPFTGLLVELSAGDEVVCVGKFVEGRPHGYWVDYLDGRPTSVDESTRLKPRSPMISR